MVYLTLPPVAQTAEYQNWPPNKNVHEQHKLQSLPIEAVSTLYDKA